MREASVCRTVTDTDSYAFLSVILTNNNVSFPGSLRIRLKNMKRILSLCFCLALAIVGISGYAQSSQITTLSSGDDVKIYFGPQSFKEAVAAATDGDVITMSAGIFDSPGDIKKTLTVRGAGMGLENYKPYISPTIINGNTYLYNDFNGEGLRFNSEVTCYGKKTVTFNKCYLNKLYSYSSGITKCTLVQSFVNYNLNSIYWDLYAINSCLGISNHNDYFNGVFLNCYIWFYWYSSYKKAINNSTFTNCIVRNKDTTYQLAANESAIYYNCLFYGVNGGKSFDNVMKNGTCYGGNTVEKVFKDDSFYELLDTYKTLKGSDGNQIGIYGGNLGFDITPTNPQITRFNVAPKTSVDGKLSIELEVKGAE